MIRRPPRATRTDTLVPYTTLVRSPWHRLRVVSGSAAPDTGPCSVPSPPCPVQGGIRCTWRCSCQRLGGCAPGRRPEEHTSELQSLMRISYAVFCLKNKKHTHNQVRMKTNHYTK